MGWILAGFLVGFGTKLGSGCTSGHGVCGLPRWSPRSFIAVLIFILFGIGMATLRSYYPFLNHQKIWTGYSSSWKYTSFGIFWCMIVL